MERRAQPVLLQHLGRIHERVSDRLRFLDRTILQLDDALAARSEVLQEHDQWSVQEHGLGSERRRLDVKRPVLGRLEFDLRGSQIDDAAFERGILHDHALGTAEAELIGRGRLASCGPFLRPLVRSPDSTRKLRRDGAAAVRHDFVCRGSDVVDLVDLVAL